MSTQNSINDCVSRIEAHLKSPNPKLDLVHAEMNFLQVLNSMLSNDIEVGDGPKCQEQKISKSVDGPSGTVIICLENQKNVPLEVEEDIKFRKVLRNDLDWASENYKTTFSHNPEETFNKLKESVKIEHSSKYTLPTGETAYLIKIA